MRPHLLSLTAFGPFAGTVSVDLDALAASGLFLLHGPTGAGKTTLLDGIGFALFGRVPGVRNSAKRLRSDHAETSVRTEVCLEATCGDRRIRVTRSPAWERPKARGTGTTVEPARVLLEEVVDGSWVALSTRPREADDEIADLVGMSAEQFFQVVLLPQGDFAQFLHASSVDRAAMLQKLFATGRFADVEDWLSARRRATAEQVGVARESLGRLLARISEVAGPLGAEPVGVDPVLLTGAQQIVWCEGLLAEAIAAADAGAAAVGLAAADRDRCRLGADDAVRLAALQHRRREVLARLVLIDEGASALRDLQAQVDAAARAAEVVGALAAVGDRRTSRDEVLAVESAARAGLVPVGLDVGLPVAGLRAAAAAARERAGRLEALRVVDDSRAAAATEAARARDELADALAQLASLEVEQVALPVRRTSAAAQLAAAREAAAQMPMVRAARDALALLRPEVAALVQVAQRVATLIEERLSARETALALEVKAGDLRVASINSMVAALAFRLQDGVPCDVCGSVLHPDPSRLRDEGVSSDDEERARREADAAQEVVAAVQSRLAAEQATDVALRSRVGALTLAEVDADLADLDVRLAGLEVVALQVAPSEAALATLDQQRADLATSLVAVGSRAEACERRARDAEARVAIAATELEAVLTPGADLRASIEQTAARVAAAEEAVAATEAAGAAQQELDRAWTAAEIACAAAGFVSSELATAAQRTSTWRAEAGGKLRAAADVAAAVAAELADPALDVDLEATVPAAATATALRDADAVLSTALEELGEQRQRRTSVERLKPALHTELATLEPLEAQAREIRALADLCAGAGANGLRMTLASFVLAARLEEVAAAASVRLLRMTQGRYCLVHTDGAARGGQRSGLGLLARDGWSGQDRDTSTLSGGETFLASLALALGLADVVSAEAGGSRIGALFVDEGFGTLDEDALDEVMDVLDGLREGGRVVGVVSHVSELRQRIPAQVHVMPSPSGSSLELRGC